VATDISRLLTRSASATWSFQTNPHIWACCSVSNISLQATKNCYPKTECVGGKIESFFFFSISFQNQYSDDEVQTVWNILQNQKNTKNQLPSFTACLYVNPKFMFWVSGCTLPESIPVQTRHSFMRRKKGGKKKPQHRRLPEDLKRQRKRKTHANYIPLASGFFLKRFIFSSAVWTPLLLCFPPPPIKRLRNKNEGLFQIFLSSSLPASTLPQMQKRGQTHNALPTPPSQPASQLWRHTKLTAYFLKFTSKRSTTMQQPCIGWWPAVEEWEECEECMGNPQQRRSRRRRRRRQECCADEWNCVCVLCVTVANGYFECSVANGSISTPPKSKNRAS